MHSKPVMMLLLENGRLEAGEHLSDAPAGMANYSCKSGVITLDKLRAFEFDDVKALVTCMYLCRKTGHSLKRVTKEEASLLERANREGYKPFLIKEEHIESFNAWVASLDERSTSEKV